MKLWQQREHNGMEGARLLKRSFHCLAYTTRQPNPSVDHSLTYSDMPRIHYSRKPDAYKIYQPNPTVSSLFDVGPPSLSLVKKYLDAKQKKSKTKKKQKK